MAHPIIAEIEKNYYKSNKLHPDFRPGDTIKVHYKIEEGTTKDKGIEQKKFRIQAFEGVCTRVHRAGKTTTFTVRKIGANSIGVERVFPLFSPMVDSIDVVSGGSVRRARLYYLRERAGKAARIKSRYIKSEHRTTRVVAE